MPKFLENILKKAASGKGFKGKRAAKYVYGAMNNMGAMRGNKETAKGMRMEAKHAHRGVRSVIGKLKAKRMRSR